MGKLLILGAIVFASIVACARSSEFEYCPKGMKLRHYELKVDTQKTLISPQVLVIKGYDFVYSGMKEYLGLRIEDFAGEEIVTKEIRLSPNDITYEVFQCARENFEIEIHRHPDKQLVMEFDLSRKGAQVSQGIKIGDDWTNVRKTIPELHAYVNSPENVIMETEGIVSLKLVFSGNKLISVHYYSDYI